MGCHLERMRTFWFVCLCGLAGVLLDIDHPIAYYLIPPVTGWQYGKILGRFLHYPVALASVIVLCLAGAYIRRLYRGYILGSRNGQGDR